MEGRMTVCNMSIEGGARAGLIAPDEKTFEFLKGAARAEGRDVGTGVRYWEDAATPTKARISTEIVVLDAAKLPPIVTWGSSPEDVISISGIVPNPADIAGREQAHSPSGARWTIWA
jgi:3-isopropylmalate/(R)-2-methylmalate dehydratase large subunit